MVSEKATLVNPQGLHMRPAGLFASTMGKFACDVTVVTPDKEVNGKSPMALMAAGIPCGTEVEVKCDGADEAEALAAAKTALDELDPSERPPQPTYRERTSCCSGLACCPAASSSFSICGLGRSL